jgi:hypothetical protein
MKHIHVCLVSDQTIPNILSIDHFSPDELLFISTKEMEQKNKASSILNTLERLAKTYEGKTSTIIVQEDSILDCHRKIDEWIQGREDSEFTVNLTCGNKIMSISAYEYFKDFNSKMIYIPIPKNEFIAPFPKKRPGNPISLALRLGVIEYLTAYGLSATNEKNLARYHQESLNRRDITAWIANNYEKLKKLLVWLSGTLRGHRDDREFDLHGSYYGATNEEIDLMQRLDIIYQDGDVSKILNRSVIKYLTGGWLEEFCYNTIETYLGHGIDNAVIGLELVNKHGRNNEFDVMFTKDNALYFVECKSLDQHDDKEADVLYKIGALQKDFGLKVKSFLVTTSPYVFDKKGNLRNSVKARAEQFNTVIVPPDEVANFGERLAHILKLSAG